MKKKIQIYTTAKIHAATVSKLEQVARLMHPTRRLPNADVIDRMADRYLSESKPKK